MSVSLYTRATSYVIFGISDRSLQENNSASSKCVGIMKMVFTRRRADPVGSLHM